MLFVSCTQAKDGSELVKLTDVKGISVQSDTVGNDSSETKDDIETDENSENIILNVSSKKIHLSSECSSVSSMSEKNKLVRPKSDLENYLENGYSICSSCNKKYGDGDK